METDEGRQRYRLRKQTVETGFEIIKAVQGFRSFLLRGVERVCTEWTLVTLAYNNNKRLHTLRLVQQRQGRAGSGSRSGKRSLERWIASLGRQNVGLQTAPIRPDFAFCQHGAGELRCLPIEFHILAPPRP